MGMAGILLLLSLYLHINEELMALGVFAILLAAIAKIIHSQFAFLASICSLIIMLMFNTFLWVDDYGLLVFTRALSGSYASFFTGLLNDLFCLTAILLYYFHLKNFKFTYSHDWFKPKSYLKLLKGLAFYELFLILFWSTSFILHTYFSHPGYNPLKYAAIGAITALIIIIYPIYKTFIPAAKTGSTSRSSRHRRKSSRSQSTE